MTDFKTFYTLIQLETGLNSKQVVLNSIKNKTVSLNMIDKSCMKINDTKNTVID